MGKNASKYNKSRFASFLSGFLPSLISLFMRRDKDLVIFNSFHNMSFSDNTKFLFLYVKEHERKTFRYVINDYALREHLTEQYGNFFMETTSFKGKLYALRSPLWLVNSFELPVSGLFLRCRRIVIHFGHGAPIKNGGLCEKSVSLLKKIYYTFLRTDISYTVSSSDVFSEYLARHCGISRKNVIKNGYPRYDIILNHTGKKQFYDGFEGKRILYAPTWRHYTDTRLFPFADRDFITLQRFLAERDIAVYIRPHPRFADEALRDVPFGKNIYEFSGLDYPEINEWLPCFDALITDYSSIMYDFMLLNRPIFYFDYDYIEYEKNVGFAVDYKTYAVGYHVHSQKEFCDALTDAFSVDSYRYERQRISRLCSGASKSNCSEFIKKIKYMGIF